MTTDMKLTSLNMNDQVSIGSKGARTATVESDDTKTTVFIADNMFNLDEQ